MRRQLTVLTLAIATALYIASARTSLHAVSDGVVISQVYGGGGNSGATLKNDFVELFNRGSAPVTLTGWSVQYAASAGTSWQVTTLSGTLQPGQYYLVQEAQGAGGSVSLPTPDAIGAIPMSATAGKVALVNGTSALSGACPTGIVDFVGFGTAANCFEGTGPTATLSNTTAALRKNNGAQDTDDNKNDFSTGTPNPRNSGSPANPQPTLLLINQIQGTGIASPYANKFVETTGIVTGVKSNGFFIQSRPADVDADPATSEGVFVFTSSHPATTTGDYVDVVGTVQEFFPGGGAVSTTEIAGPTVTVLNSGNALPDPVDLAALGVPTADGGFFQLERYEGMRVSLDSFTVVEGNGGTVNEPNATATTFGDFYGVRTGTALPFREPGVEAPRLPPNPPCCIAQFDANPERLRLDSTALGGTKIVATPGAVIVGIVGTLEYNFGAFGIDLDGTVTPTVSGNNASATPVPAPGAAEFTIGAFNMEHFYDTVDDADTPFDVALTTTAYANRLMKASLAIRNVMRTPDIVGLEEVEHPAVLQDIASQISADAAAAGQPDPQYFPILFEGNDPSGIDSGILVKQDGRVTIVDYEQVGKDATFNNPPETLNDRPPVVLRAMVHVPGASPVPVTVIVNHLKALSGVDTLDATGARNRAKRAGQAEFLANLIQQHQAAGEHVVAVGDFNAFQFNDGYVDVIGTVKGTPAPADQVLVATQSGLVSPPLDDLVDAVSAAQRYSYSFDGNLQVLDHVIVTHDLMALAPHLEYGRMDAGFPESLRGDATRPERLSDHDPAVAYFFVADDLPPTIASVTPSQTSMWPPNKRMVPITIAVAATDGRDPAPVCTVNGVTSNEGTSADWAIDGPLAVSLRADRDGKGSGRIYTVAVECTDASGNASRATAVVTVPHDQR